MKDIVLMISKSKIFANLKEQDKLFEDMKIQLAVR